MLRFYANWYRIDEFGTMNGLCFAVGGIGGVARTPPFAIVVDFTRWRTTIRVLALFGLAIAGATATVVRDSAERSGLPPIENVPEYSRLSIAEVRTFTVRIISDQWTWVIAILLYCSGGVNLTLIGLWGILYIVQIYDVSVMAASTTTLLGGVGVAVGSPVFGRLSNVIDRQTEFIICGAIVYTSALGLIAIVGDPPLIVVGVVSFLNGSLLGTFVLTYSMIQRRYDDRASGIALKTINGALVFRGGFVSDPNRMGSRYLLDRRIHRWCPRVYDDRVSSCLCDRYTAVGVVAIEWAVWLHYQRV